MSISSHFQSVQEPTISNHVISIWLVPTRIPTAICPISSIFLAMDNPKWPLTLQFWQTLKDYCTTLTPYKYWNKARLWIPKPGTTIHDTTICTMIFVYLKKYPLTLWPTTQPWHHPNSDSYTSQHCLFNSRKNDSFKNDFFYNIYNDNSFEKVEDENNFHSKCHVYFLIKSQFQNIYNNINLLANWLKLWKFRKSSILSLLVYK